MNTRRLKIFPVITSLSIILTSFCLEQDNDWVAPNIANQLVNPFDKDLKATMKGKKIYQKLCWSCHGLDGTGDGPASTALTPKPANYTSEKLQNQSDGAIFWKISNGRGQMTSYEQTLSEDQRWMLVNYIRELAKKQNF